MAADLPQFLQRRELAAYEQRLARTAYAYGVDLRRAQWLATSTVGDPLMRTVDRRWSRLVAGLDEDSLKPLRKSPPTALLEELARLMHLLRAPLPTLRVLRPEVADQWPAVTPLGTTKGGIHWLVLDLGRVQRMAPHERTFALASGLAHLQCDHGPIFAAHLMAHREGRAGLGLVKGLLRPWAKVSVFSADRAGLVAVSSLEVALEALEAQAAEHPAWMPRWPDLALRRQALEDFDRSALMARRRVLSGDGHDWTMAPPGREQELDSVGRKLAAAFDGAIKLGGRLAMRIEGYEPRPTDDPDDAQGSAKAATEAATEPATHEGPAGEASTTDAAPEAASEPPEPPEPPTLDPERASALEEALSQAWTLARCDQRLTRRLGLL